MTEIDGKKITVIVDLTFNDYFRAITNRTFKVRRQYMILAIIFILPVLGFSIFLTLNDGSIIYALLLLVVFPAIFAGLFFNVFRQARKLAARAGSSIEWTFRESSYHVTSEHGEAEVKWSGIDDVVETGKDFLLVVGVVFFIIPKRFFENSQLAEFRQHVRDSIGEKAKLLS